MANQFDYTDSAYRYTARFPALSYIGTQINFWIVANILLLVIVHLYANFISEAFNVSIVAKFSPMLLIAVILGLFYGVSLGSTDYYLDRKFFRKLSLGRVLLFKTMLSIILVTIILRLLRFVLFDPLVSPSLVMPGIILNDKAWDYLFCLLLVYYFFMTLVISFINQVNKKYGPGVLVPLLFGRYRRPKEEERIFMFMDLKSSTSTAERLGHLKYSSFLRDCFADINEVLHPFRAQIYQYVGDEVVVMWSEHEGLNNQLCVKFYFACKKQFKERTAHYVMNYGFIPVFKAGLHMGKVTAVEIGEIKKDIAYHGDTLNTSARIQSVCNDYQKDFLVSEYLIQKIGIDKNIKIEELGMVLLKGKTQKIGIVSVVEI